MADGRGAVNAAEPVPGWLAAWRERGPAPPAQRERRTRQGCSGASRPVSPTAEAQRPKPDGLGFVIPDPWPYDGGQRREPVLDTAFNPARIVRRVGWRTCLTCRKPFFSEDVIALRLCDGTFGCRDPKPRLANSNAATLNNGRPT